MLTPITLHTDDAADVEAFLTERIVEFNARATGYFDAASFAATQQDEEGVIRAGLSGYTWGGCCYVSYLWIDERDRGRGLGTALLLAAEEHARTKGCAMMLLSSHSFQAPGFYEKQGYERYGGMSGSPQGESRHFYVKRLR